MHEHFSFAVECPSQEGRLIVLRQRRARPTKFLGLLIPGSRLAHVGVDIAHAQPREHDGIIGGAQRKRGSRTTCFSGALEDKPGGSEVARCDELLPLFDKSVHLTWVEY